MEGTLTLTIQLQDERKRHILKRHIEVTLKGAVAKAGEVAQDFVEHFERCERKRNGAKASANNS